MLDVVGEGLSAARTLRNQKTHTLLLLSKTRADEPGRVAVGEIVTENQAR
jgi:hypothetical protein